MNKYLRKFIFLFFLISLTFTACSKNQAVSNNKDDKKVIYASFFPVYDLTSRIVGDKMEVRQIIEGNQEPHDFELQAKDMAKISNADLIIYNGANMEAFIDDLKEVAGDEKKFLDLSKGLTLLTKGNNSETDKARVNPHTWLSIKNDIVELSSIYKKVSSMDPKNEKFYRENLNKSVEEFKNLDNKFQQELSKITDREKYFVVSHAAFNYLARDYGLKQIAVTGISPDEEPSAKELKVIADFVKANNIKTIFFEGKATPKVAKTLAENTNTKTDTLYTMENLTPEEMQKGYLELMEENLEALMRSFNE
ncbi:metal ABC transporter substrate-binding protein [Peptoniphilus lacrimalis DNF00528]|nr:metal ABC transporter substrate-binding protein [Peptoniphilus lacrimalis DNF00528]